MKHKHIALAIVAFFLVMMIGPKLNIPLTSTTNKNVTQLSSETIMSPEEMQEDIQFLVDKIVGIHPKTSEGITPELKTEYEKVLDIIKEPMKAGEFLFHAATIAATMQDAHTAVLYNSSDKNLSIDLPLSWLMRSLCVREQTEVFEPGDEILMIGNKNVADILTEMAKFIPAENEGWVRARAEKMIVCEPFLRYLQLVNDDNTVSITYRRKKITKEVELPLIKPLIINAASNTEWIGYTLYQELSLGILRLDKCIYNQHYQDKVKEFFSQVAANGIANIAIDVRNNPGGNSRVMDEIMSYLTKVEEYQQYSMLIRYSKDVAKQRSGVWRRSGIREYKSKVTQNKLKKDKSVLFSGDLFILTSYKTFSSGNWIAVMAQDNNFATVIGEPTGNAPSSYGDVLSFPMPNSGYYFSVSYKNFKRPNQEKDPASTLWPDIIVYTVAEDLRVDRDPQVESLIALISGE